MESFLNSALLIGSLLLLSSVILSKSSNKFGLPILVLFMFIGILAGTEGFLGIDYENYELTHSLSVVAICVIIFSGGLSTNFSEVKPILKSGILLSSVGVILTTAIVGVFCHYIFHIPIFEAFLIGAILSSTDAAAVFTAFRDKSSQVSKNLKSVLEFESGSNDPMAYLLVTIFLDLYKSTNSMEIDFIEKLFFNPCIGIIGAVVFYHLFKFVNEKIELDFQGLYPALSIGFLFLTYSAVTKLEGNGFLAVYLFGLMLGNNKILHKNALLTFFDGASWLFQIGLFIMLGLLVFPSRLLSIAPSAIGVSLLVIFVARPAATYICLFKSKFNFKEKFFVSWAGLKGATPIVFASMAATNLGKEASFIFDVVFFCVLVSALVQGMTLKLMAKKLHLLIESVQDPSFPVDLEVLEKTKYGIKEFVILEEDYAVSNRIVDLNLPKGSIVLFIKRNGAFIIPDGSTSFEALDRVLIVSSEKEHIFSAILHFKKKMEFEKLVEEEDEVALEDMIKVKEVS